MSNMEQMMQNASTEDQDRLSKEVSWTPEVLDYVWGDVVGFEEGETQYGTARIARIDGTLYKHDQDEKITGEILVWLCNVQLERKFDHHDVSVGDTVGVKRLPDKANKMAKQFYVDVEKAGPPTPEENPEEGSTDPDDSGA